MEKLKIERIYRGKKETRFDEKDTIALKLAGNKYLGKDGQPAWVSSFKTKGTEHWKEGDEVEVTVTENKGFFNFEVGDVVTLDSLNERLKKVESHLFKEKTIDLDEPDTDYRV